MSGKSSKLAPFFASPTASRTAHDAELKRAIQLSEEEARFANMSEEQLLQQALEASRADLDDKTKRSRSPSIGHEEAAKPAKKSKTSTPLLQITDTAAGDDDDTELNFTPESFGEKEEIINRLNGSLDLIYCKGWIRRQERVRLREWMLKELMWHRVSSILNATR